MYIGIDVGGTCTDAVVIYEGTILAWAKTETLHNNLLKSVLTVLDDVLAEIDIAKIKRVTLSTTIVTNQIVEGKEEATDIFVITGPGANLEGRLPAKFIKINGYTDHRGVIAEKFTEQDVLEYKPTAKHAAVSAKFAVRNPSEEVRLAKIVKSLGYDYVSEGSKLSGNLNFIRRTNSAYFNSAVSDGFKVFKLAVEEALKSRKIKAPLYILKADGGSLPIKDMQDKPIETVFTGPAASVLGMEALLHVSDAPTVAMDIGGTTTDISLWENGVPLLARGGVDIAGYASSVRSFQVLSVGIGGDSWVRVENKKLKVGPERKGKMMAIGGIHPTLGDALIVLGTSKRGDYDLACKGISEISGFEDIILDEEIKTLYNTIFGTISSEITLEEKAKLIVVTAIRTIKRGVEKAISQENKKPIYVVEDIINPKLFIPEKLVVVGGSAETLAKFIGQGLKLPAAVPKAAMVANAVGACVAKATLELTLRVDTAKRLLVIPELGIMQRNTPINSLNKAKKMLNRLLVEEASKIEVQENYETETLLAENFPVVQGWSEVNYLITLRMQLKAGVRTYVKA